MDILQTTRTYATRAKAVAHLSKQLAAAHLSLDDARFCIAVSADGRFAPVLFPSSKLPLGDLVPFAHCGVTVVA